MEIRTAFLQAILDDPGDVNRLVFADWLVDHGEEDLARWFRQPRSPVEVAWAVIRDWIERHYPTMLALLNGPAEEGGFKQLERQIGQQLPDGFKASYRIHDGSDPLSGILIGLPLLSLAEIGDVWQVKLRWPSWPGSSSMERRGSVPFAGDALNHVAIDFAPGPKGKIGQISSWGGGVIHHIIAETFEGFMAFVARQFVNGKVGLNSEESPVGPRWLAVVGGNRHLLAGLSELLGLSIPTR